MTSAFAPGTPGAAFAAGVLPAEPLFCGRDARVFGFYHAPSGAVRGAAVALVNPFGYEALCAHRAYRRLAERLATAGFPVLRFDLDGTGDSTGDDRDPGRVAAWIASIGDAVDELRARSLTRDVVLFGVRLGALLALAVAAERGDVAGLALVAPCLSGRAYARELRAFRRLADKGALARAVRGRGERDEEVAGFLLTEATLAELGRLDALELDPRGARVLVVPRDDVPSGEERLVERLDERGAVEARPAAGYGAMMQEPHKSVVPGPAFDAVVDWLEAGYPPIGAGALIAAEAVGPPARTRSVATDVREELVRYGEGDRLFGVLCGPLGGAPPERPAVVLLNAGALHRVGPNRTYVRLARRLAAAGFTALRMDLGGIGDSRPSRDAPDNRVYSRDAVADVDAAMSFLAVRSGASRFALVGLCSGAYVAFHTALVDQRVSGALMINPQTFTWKEGDSLDVSQSRNYSEVRHYQSALFQREKWAKALRGEVDFRYVARTFGRRAVLLARTRLRRLVASARGTVVEDDVPGALALLARRGVQVLLVMSEGDPGLDYLAQCVGPAARRATAHYRLVVIDGPDHTFTPLWSQDELCARALSFVVDLARSR